jgi:sterol desaturase/sphingolipid hydroxylase (fatty acid hydroxylase superfamily)
MIGIPIGLLYASAGEWLIHRYFLHGLSADDGEASHARAHHRNARRFRMYDPDYEQLGVAWNAPTKEVLGLAALAAVHVPLLPVAPFFPGTVLYSIVRYFRVHRRAHLEPAWAEANLPWHVDHHLGRDVEANWGISRPWMDHWMGTRKVRQRPRPSAKRRATRKRTQPRR